MSPVGRTNSHLHHQAQARALQVWFLGMPKVPLGCAITEACKTSSFPQSNNLVPNKLACLAPLIAHNVGSLGGCD
jgi:hypothetical protein